MKPKSRKHKQRASSKKTQASLDRTVDLDHATQSVEQEKTEVGTAQPYDSPENEQTGGTKFNHRWFSFRQKWFTESQITASVALCAVVLNGILVYVTWQQFSVYRSSIHSELRAYVACGKNEFGVTFFNPSDVAKVHFRNFGHTPALNCRIRYQQRLFSGDFPDNPPYDLSIDSLSYFQIIGGGGETWFDFHPFKDVTTDSLREQIIGGKINMYVYGTFTYEDIFRDCYTLKFCYKLDPPNGATRFFTYRKYNREESCDD